MYFDPMLDLFPFTAALLAALVCALLGNFLVLRRLSLMGDAISHSVLPGLVVAFLITSSREPGAMFIGAALAGVATVVLVELVKRLGKVEPGAAMGVVFSVLFALGVLLIEQAAADQIDLDAECVLHGQLELLTWWDAPDTFVGLWSMETLDAAPRQVRTLLWMFALAVVFVVVFFKELRIAAFDPALATAQGISAGVMHYALMIFVAAATVASFEAVGSILVIAMLICPAATARLLTDRLKTQVALSLVLASGAATLGYFGATIVPGVLGFDSVNAAGSIAVASGALLAVAVVGSPSHGLVGRLLRRRRIGREVAMDDALATLFRAEESDGGAAAASGAGVGFAVRKGYAEVVDGAARLTGAGRARARGLVRRHRLWERYLVDEAGYAPDHVHDTAEEFEHTRYAPEPGARTDPHGRPIPGDEG